MVGTPSSLILSLKNRGGRAFLRNGQNPLSVMKLSVDGPLPASYNKSRAAKVYNSLVRESSKMRFEGESFVDLRGLHMNDI